MVDFDDPSILRLAPVWFCTLTGVPGKIGSRILVPSFSLFSVLAKDFSSRSLLYVAVMVFDVCCVSMVGAMAAHSLAASPSSAVLVIY